MVEKIRVFIQFGEDGTIECLCKQGKKGCKNWCEKAIVFYDRFYGWQSTYNYSKYRKSNDKGK